MHFAHEHLMNGYGNSPNVHSSSSFQVPPAAPLKGRSLPQYLGCAAGRREAAAAAPTATPRSSAPSGPAAGSGWPGRSPAGCCCCCPCCRPGRRGAESTAQGWSRLGQETRAQGGVTVYPRGMDVSPVDVSHHSVALLNFFKLRHTKFEEVQQCSRIVYIYAFLVTTSRMVKVCCWSHLKNWGGAREILNRICFSITVLKDETDWEQWGCSRLLSPSYLLALWRRPAYMCHQDE